MHGFAERQLLTDYVSEVYHGRNNYNLLEVLCTVVPVLIHPISTRVSAFKR